MNEHATFVESEAKKFRGLFKQITQTEWDLCTIADDAAAERAEQAQKAWDDTYSDKKTYQKVKHLLTNCPHDPVIKRQLELLKVEYLSKQGDSELLAKKRKLEIAITQKSNTFRAIIDGEERTDNDIRDILSKSRAVNVLSGARLFLFAARDVWFVVALPVFLSDALGWGFWAVGGFLAAWVIGYGAVQTVAPYVTGLAATQKRSTLPDGRTALGWAVALAGVPAGIAIALSAGLAPTVAVVGGLALFGLLFAVNSALHSYLIVSYAAEDGVSLDVGFYYMSNAMGRLAGTVLSGWAFQAFGLGSNGLEACLWISSACIAAAAALSVALPRHGPDAKPVAVGDMGD